MTKLTKVELLDRQFPGLADQVRRWFVAGHSCVKVAELLRHQYGEAARLGQSTVGSFRVKRWVPEREMLREKKISILAAQEVAQEREIKAALACKARGEVE